MKKLMADCPRHDGSYDCTPFCGVCQGEQEYEWTPFRRCVTCPTEVEHDVWFEEFGMCVECSNEYFTDDESEA
jgi:hypothetical protein